MEIFDPGHKEVPFTSLRRHFPNFKPVCKAIEDAQVAKVEQMFAKIPEIWNTKDTSFSAYLVDALQACLPEESSYRFIDSSHCTLPRVSNKPNLRPDIVLVESRPPTPLSTAPLESTSCDCSTSQPEASTSAPLSPQWDEILMVGDTIRKNRRETGEICMQDKEGPFTKHELNTLKRTSDRVGAQWFRRPQRHLFHFTATSTFIRIWHWSPGRIIFTAPIYYRKDPRPVLEFFTLWALAERDVRGEDVEKMDGEDFDWNLFTFGRPLLSQRHTDRLTAVLQGFNELHGPKSSLFDAKTTVYEFKHGHIASSTPTVDTELVTHDEEEINFEAMMPHTDADFDFFASSIHPQKGGVSCSERKLGGHSSPDSSPEEPLMASDAEAETLLVFDLPIAGHSDVSFKSTRCYVAVRKSDIEGNQPVDEIPVHLLKLSWQESGRKREYEWYRQVQNGSFETKVPFVVRAMGGGEIPTKRRPKGKQLVWVVLEQVGVPLSKFRSTRELTAAIRDGIRGHKNCLKRGVLHRDISASNVMIDVKTREGFIIDLDLALQWPASVDHHWTLTGTIPFLALSRLSESVPHRPRHDLESFFWVWIWCLLRHAPHLKVTGVPIVEPSQRTKAFYSVFDDRKSLMDAFYTKQNAILGATRIASDIMPLRLALIDIVRLTRKGPNAMHEAFSDLESWQSLSAMKEHPKETQTALTECAESQKRAISDALNHHELLQGFNKCLLRLNWLSEDAAVPFQQQDLSLVSSATSASSAHTSAGAVGSMHSNRGSRKRPRDPPCDPCYLPSPKKSRSV